MIQGESLCGERGGRGIADQTPTDPPQGRAPIPPAWRAWTVVIAVLIAWQLGWAVDLIPPIGLPSPLEIVIALWQLISSGELWDHLEATLVRLGLGWSLGVAAVILAAMMSRRWSIARSAVVATTAVAAAVPAIALLPLFMIWLGTGRPRSSPPRRSRRSVPD